MIRLVKSLYYKKILSPAYSIYLKYMGVSVGRGVIFYGAPLIMIYPGSKIIIGDRCVFCSDSMFTALGLSCAVTIKTLSRNARIFIGNDVGASGVNIISYSSVSIGDECMLGAGVKIIDTDFHPINPENRRKKSVDFAKSSPVAIDRNCFIGMDSVIFKGVIVGENSVIGAGELVRQNVPSDSIFVNGGVKCLKK